MATYEDKMGDIGSMSSSDLSALETEITSAFTAADNGDDLDAMSAAATALQTVRDRKAEVEATEASDTPEVVGETVTASGEEAETEVVTDEAVTADGGENPFAKKDPEDPEDAIDNGADEDTENPDGTKKDEETVMASAETETTNQAEEAAVDLPEDRQPVATYTPSNTIVAGADIPGYSAGTEFPDSMAVATAFTKRLETLRNVRGGNGEQVIVASIHSEASEDRTLEPGDLEGNARKIKAVTEMDAIIASGGYCAPLEVRYDIYGLGVADRPVKAALAGFQTKRGGIRYVQPPVLSDLANAVGIWTATEDALSVATVTTAALTSNVATITTAAAHGLIVGQAVTIDINNAAFDGTFVIASVPTTTTFTYAKTHANVTSAAADGTATPTKPRLKVTCQSELTAVTDAVTLSIEFGNLAARAFPELVNRHNELGLIQHARLADLTLLSKISALSTAVTSSSKLGTARDFLEAVGRAAAAYRHRHRMGDEAVLRVIAPRWVLDAMREDLTMGLPGDQLEWADSVINGFFSTRRVNVSWHLDDASTLSAAQSAGALNAWPTTFKWNLFSEGTFLFLDGGTLDLGIIRDSGLVSVNDYMMFLETFEGVAKVGIEALEVTTTTTVNGSVAATEDTRP